MDQLELNYKRSRIRLTEVSRDFVRYKEDDIRQAYEKATQLQLDVMIYREKEMYLKARRDELQKVIEMLKTLLNVLNPSDHKWVWYWSTCQANWDR